MCELNFMTSRETVASLRKARLTGQDDDVEANLGAFLADLRKTTKCEPATGNNLYFKLNADQI